MIRLAAVFATLCVLAVPRPSAAQVASADIVGVVKDESGGVIPGAGILVTNLATKATVSGETSGMGIYLITDLSPGAYRVDVTMLGFKPFSRQLMLVAGQRVSLDVALVVVPPDGGKISVDGCGTTADYVNFRNAMPEGITTCDRLERLPLAARNWDDLLALVPGVQMDRATDQGGGTAFGRTGGISVHGARTLQNNFLLDGGDNNGISTNVQELATQVLRPSLDAIEEIRVVTTPYAAEYGRAPGAAVVVTTKSGTNRFKGTAYEYVRAGAMDAIDMFSKKAGAPAPLGTQHQPGGNIGGPIVREHVFFFVDYEATRISRDVSRMTRVPTAAERAGVFTSAVRDPVTGLPFAGNTIPASRIDPYAAAILALVPLPNQPGATNFFRTAGLVDNGDRLLAKVDWAANRDRVSGRSIHSTRDRRVPGAFGGVLDGTGTSAFGNQTIATDAIAGAWSHVISPRMLNETRVSWSRVRAEAAQQPYGLAPPPAAQIPGAITDPAVAGGLPGLTVAGYFGGAGLGRLGSPDFLPKSQHTNQVEYQEALTWVPGAHQLKVGVDVVAPIENQYVDVPAPRGAMNFGGTFTGQPLGDFLLGYVSGFQISNPHVANQRHWAAMGFARDEWKVSKDVTLNLGLRYDFITPALEAQNRQANVDPSAAGRLVVATAGSLESRGLVRPDRNNWAPRADIVYVIDDRTVARGGWGLFYTLFDRLGSDDQLALNPPGLVNTRVSRSSGTPLFLLKDGIPAGALTPPDLDPAAGDLQSLRLRAVAHEAPKAQVQQASAGFQREVAYSWILSADYVHARGRHLATLVNLNQPLPSAPGARDARGPLPYPDFGVVEWRAQNGTSSYDGVDLGLQRGFRQRFLLGATYTLGNARDEAPEALTTAGSSAFPQDSRDVAAWRGPSDFDVRHRFTACVALRLPLGENMFLRDWIVSGVHVARSGLPFTVVQSSNDVGQLMTGLPDVTGDPRGSKTIDRWFNTAAFTPVPSGVFGNERRNQLRGPGFQTFDLAVQRAILLGRYSYVTLRWEAFNLFNRTNLGLPARDISSSDAGTITSLSSDPRTMQLAVRFSF